MGQQNSSLDIASGNELDDIEDFNGTYSFEYPKSDVLGRLKYYGEWKDGKRHGKGTLEWRSGSVYYGDWINDNLTGIGTFDMGKMIYEGEFKNNQFNGSGVLLWKNTYRRYEGQWKDNKYNGFGVMHFSNFDKHERVSYVGSWENGKRHGYGIMKWITGSKYEGHWFHGKREGKGKQTFANGDVHIGNWVGALRHGEGTRILFNGDKYKGTWKDDKMNGNFEFITSYGRKKNICYIDGEEVKQKTKQDVQSLQIYCTETIAKNRKQYKKLESISLPDHLANPIHLCKKSQKNIFSRIISEVMNT